MAIQRMFPPFPFATNARLVVGVSGGADSLGLLFLLKGKWPQAIRQLVIAHVNYGLRGRDSLLDEKRVRQLCLEEKLPFRCKRVKGLKERAKKEKKSFQDLAREIRYSFFQKTAQKEHAWGVAVAHHQEDQAETVLDRLLRGAGTKGLSGLRPVQTLNFSKGKRPLKVWRPLLAFSKKQIQDYLNENGITWREDRSNRTTDYRRNQIRHEVIPFLSRWNGNLVETIARVGEISSAEDQVLDGFLALVGRQVKSRWIHGFYSCEAKSFQNLPLAFQRRWVRHVCEQLTTKARGLSFDRIEEIIRLWEGREKGPRDLGFGLVAEKSGNKAFLRWKSNKGPVSLK
jgi:tRNA(Ile)-lysidine synthase